MKKYLSIRDITPLLKWKDIKKAIKYYYPSDKNDYEKLFSRLQKMEKVRTKTGEELQISGGMDMYEVKDIKKVLKEIEKDYYDDYYSINIKKKGEDIYYSLSFVKWNYLSNLPICEDTLTHYMMKDIVAHFIWEITFYGNEKQTKKTADEMISRVKEIKKDIKKEKKKK